jgi:hypothetical protein
LNFESCVMDDLRLLYEIAFDSKKVSSWWRKRILLFDGFNFAETIILSKKEFLVMTAEA